MFRKITRFFLKIILWFIVLSVFSVLLFRWVPVPITPLMVSRYFEYWDEEKVGLSHDWVPLEDISPNLQKAVIASEDATFLSHHGFDFDAMYKAYKNNKKGRKIKGGSTISQQTAKNVFLWQGRSYVRKALEAYFTFLIEMLWSKERIMEVYLNSIEMGKGVYGAQAAAQHWYKKSASSLTKQQAAGIAAILPNPIRYKAVNSSPYIQRKKNKIVRLMRYVKLEY
ncbi:monofunctional biosynthetic peptidoglycan transglycosylase [Flavobacterium cyanobacteriorum]|uniref:Biosynthetic peptidoglycan transglycosylase n=1 Tax=Flavobacterium cyanobacteriorum TaxID=2022802 RepID=A0A255Z9V2_9FLAO|nr:monofunctional biosynthetic peptidoglycan transglycosylase [Flavobacterium cyanobacteriorum]OYQ38343.1 monofunctional biosynthetic peptidoglycan transglycosylase [Flavobacterium cyanobacteriorum]